MDVSENEKISKNRIFLTYLYNFLFFFAFYHLRVYFGLFKYGNNTF
jgi:hypothetical protein